MNTPANIVALSESMSLVVTNVQNACRNESSDKLGTMSMWMALVEVHVDEQMLTDCLLQYSITFLELCTNSCFLKHLH